MWVNPMTDKKQCVLCEKELKPVGDNWDNLQPIDGGEIRFIFSYGSTEFDNHMGTTQYSGLICDKCAKKYVDKMQESGTDFHGV